MAGKPLNRLELRRQNDAAEPLDPMEDEADDLVDDSDDDDGHERKPKKKPKAAAKPKAKAVKAAKPAAQTDAQPKRASCLDAAAQVLRDAKEPMQVRAMVAAMREKGLWSSDAATPWATLYSAILREITTKKGHSRFRKTDRGHFALNA